MTTIEFAKDSRLHTIENGAFNCSSIESLTIPSTVYDISAIFTSSIPRLSKLTIMPNNKYFKNDELNDKLVIGRSSSKESLDFDELIFIPKNEKYVTIPSYIKSIKQGAFSETSINNIFIPSNVTKIGEGAFSHCMKLRRVEFAQDSQISNIEVSCFSGSSVEVIEIPSNVTIISSWAFKSCCNLKSVLFQCDSKLGIIDEYAFEDSSITSLFVPSSLNEVGYCAFLSCPIEIIELESHNEDLIILFTTSCFFGAIYMIPNK